MRSNHVSSNGLSRSAAIWATFFPISFSSLCLLTHMFSAHWGLLLGLYASLMYHFPFLRASTISSR